MKSFVLDSPVLLHWCVRIKESTKEPVHPQALIVQAECSRSVWLEKQLMLLWLKSAKGKARCSHHVAHSQGILHGSVMKSFPSAHACALKTHSGSFWDEHPGSAGWRRPGTDNQPSENPKSKAKLQRSRLWEGDWTAAPAQHSGCWCCWRCVLPDKLFHRLGSDGVPARNELRNFEMLIRQQSLASEPFPRGSYSEAIYSWNCKS